MSDFPAIDLTLLRADVREPKASTGPKGARVSIRRPQNVRSQDALRHHSPGDLVVSTDNLRLGMFVAGLDRPWLETPFPIQGFRIADRRQINKLRSLCNEVIIDLRQSAWYSIEHLGDLTPKRPGAARRLVGLVAAIYSEWVGERGAGKTVAIRRRSVSHRWSQQIAPIFGRRVVAHPAEQRVADIPDDVKPVIYHDTKPLEEAIGPARKVYRQIEVTMETFMSDLTEKREISAEAISVAASELVESIAENSEAMMWLARMHAQNVRTYTHGVEVAIYVVTLGRHLGFPRDQLKNLCMTGLLLDVGLMQIDNALIEKAAPLTESEMAEIRLHVDYSLDMLAKSPNIDPSVREGIAQHHERTDGSGYPLGLVGDEISIAGRIAAIADTFAAVTTRRPYAEPESVFSAMQILFSGAGTKFHEPLVEQFVHAIGLFPVGSLVELSTGEVAAVVSHNKVRRLKPRVLVLTGPDKQVLTAPVELNLLFDPKDANDHPVRIRRGLPVHAYGINPRNFFLT